MRTSKLLVSDIGLFTGASSDKSPGDSLLFKQSALRGVSYALTHKRASEQEETDYRSAHGDIGRLRAYDNFCVVCEYRSAARDEIEKLDASAKVFTFHVCNHSNLKAFVAISGRKNTDSDKWTIQGWWNVAPGDCTTMGPFVRGHFYYLADGLGGRRGWYGSFPLCVPNIRFEKINYGGRCVAGETLKKFKTVDIDQTDYYWNLGN